MKKQIVLILTAIFLLGNANYAKQIEKRDSLNNDAELSVFLESYKNKNHEDAAIHGWNLINSGDQRLLKFKVFKKMEKSIWNLYQDKNTSDEAKNKLTENVLTLYKIAKNKDNSKTDYYTVREAYVLETWKNAEAEKVISVYENALEINSNIQPFYKDRLGQLYAKADNKIKAIKLYSDLSELEPENVLWNSRLEKLVDGDIDQLIDVKRKLWEYDLNDFSRGWDYVQLCFKNQRYEKALIALNFMIEKEPNVTNYWLKKAVITQKLEKTDESIDSYKKLIELDSDNRDHYLNIALLYKQKGALSVSRSYLLKAVEKSINWAYPYYVEAQLYEQAARESAKNKFEFIDKCVYQLAVEKYKIASIKEGVYADQAKERIKMLSNAIPQQEDYFFRKYNTGDEIKIKGKNYSWINRSITVVM